VQALKGIALPLWTMANDKMSGAVGDQLGGDSLSIQVGLDGFQGQVSELPVAYAGAVQNEVVWVAVNSYSASPDQLDTAATNSQYLARQINQLCL
jgi:hypothetical protein